MVLYLSLAFAAEPLTSLGPTALTPTLPLSTAAQTALAARDHTAAADALLALDTKSWTDAQRDDLAFLIVWELQRAGRTKETTRYVDAVGRAGGPPSAYVSLVLGELELELGHPVDAIRDLESIPLTDPIRARARLALANAYDQAERTSDARTVLETIAAGPQPTPGGEKALWALAQRTGQGNPKTTEWVRALYRNYPGTPEDALATAWLGAPTVEDLGQRGDRLQDSGRYQGAATLLGEKLSTVPAGDCVYRFAYGRAQNKLANHSSAAAVLEPLGKLCKATDPDRGAKALYLAGKSYEAKKDYASAARAYLAVPELYPTHSMADDGYTLGGIALQFAGDLAGARRVWAKGYEAYPTGDLAGEDAWRLAWGAWLAGDATEALQWADRASAELPLTAGTTDVLASRYWAARWRIWNDPADARHQNPDAAAVAEGRRRLTELATTASWHYYGLLAANRLRLLDPAAAEAIPRPTFDADDAPWQVRDSFAQSPAVQNALRLYRIGLGQDALVELATLGDDTLQGSELAVVTKVQAGSGDFVGAHDRLRTWLKTHPPDTLGPNTWKVMRTAYPEAYADLVRQATKAYAWDGRVFQALVREESNFNPKIKSWAGACGLSQLMPATASNTAKRLGVAWSRDLIWDPATNLQIGAAYLDSLFTRYHGNPALSLAGYNAGEGNADRWLAAAAPDAPTDAVVESIDYRETRMYVKRVLSTYQTYTLLYGTGPVYADGSRWAADAVP